MNGYQYRVSLRIRHPLAHPDDITIALGLEPKIREIVGVPRLRQNGRWSPVPTLTYWVYEVTTPDDLSIEEMLTTQLEFLEPRKEYLQSLIGTGGSVEFFVGFFVDDSNCGFMLSPELLSQCGSLGIAIDFDVYKTSNCSEHTDTA